MAMPKMDKDCPCTKDCPKRTATCHGTCEEYLKWHSGNLDKCEERAKTAEVGGATYQYLRDRNNRTYRRHVRNGGK